MRATNASKVTIVRVIARLNTGGPAIHTVLLTRGIDKERFRSRLVTGVVDPTEGDMTYYAEEMAVVPTVIPELSRVGTPFSLLRAFVRLFRVLRRERPNVIHTHTTTAGALGRLAGLLNNGVARLRGEPRAKLVHTFHGHVFRGYFSPLRSFVLVLGERLLARATDRIITVSETLKRELVEHYRICPAAKVRVVPLGLDLGWAEALDQKAGMLRAQLGIPAETVIAAVIGRLTAIKNHRLFLSSLSLLGRANMAALIIGDGERRGELEQMVREQHLEDRVFFTGWLRDRAAMYADVDMVCLTSSNEGTPLVLIEAMAAGRPFVATRVGGVPDLMIGDGVPDAAGFEVFSNGITVPPNDAGVLAAALRCLLEHPELRRGMGAIGRAAVLKRFSAERLIHDVEAVYEELLATGRREGTCGR